MNKGQAFIFSISMIAFLCYPLPAKPTALSVQVQWFHVIALTFMFYLSCVIVYYEPAMPELVAFYFAYCCGVLGLYLRALRDCDYALLMEWKPPIVPLVGAVVGSALIYRSWRRAEE
jgi:hypothetical protein